METAEKLSAKTVIETKEDKKSSENTAPKTDDYLEKLWDYYRSANTHIC